MWNSVSDATGIVFEEAPGASGDLLFVARAPGTGYCAGCVRESSSIFYDTGQMNWTASDADAA
jgi:hypothetical protein